MAKPEAFIEIVGIEKKFGGFTAVDSVDLGIDRSGGEEQLATS